MAILNHLFNKSVDAEISPSIEVQVVVFFAGLALGLALGAFGRSRRTEPKRPSRRLSHGGLNGEISVEAEENVSHLAPFWCGQKKRFCRNKKCKRKKNRGSN